MTYYDSHRFRFVLNPIKLLGLLFDPSTVGSPAVHELDNGH